MQRYNILWADDEIDLLKPHILFLEEKGYSITTVVSGNDAVDTIQEQTRKFDIVFLDENMPGISGLEALVQIKEITPTTPVVMITKSEEEHIMEEAIGSQIDDYLIKPLNSNQILHSVKKILNKQNLVSEKTNLTYQQEFRNIGMAFQEDLDEVEWVDIYRKLVYWELEIDKTTNKSMAEILSMQKVEANNEFAKFISENYISWLNDESAYAPVMSHTLMDKYVFPQLKSELPVFFIVIDNFRYDQWKTMEPLIGQYFKIEQEEMYYSILPTATGYARNAIFSGLMPSEMKKKHPYLWVDDIEDEGMNMKEAEFLEEQLKRRNLNISNSYHKILNQDHGKALMNNIKPLLDIDLNVMVFNFVDMLSHARTDSKMIKELAADESAYRSLTKTWFEHSALNDVLKYLSEKKCKVVISTDHGTVRVNKPHKIIGDKNTNTNLRYKHGKNLNYDGGNIFEIKDPDKAFLPKQNISSRYVFTTNDSFFAYPNNYNHYVKYYADTFQHGGVSLEEVLVPVISLGNKPS